MLYEDLNDQEQALIYYEQALVISQAAGVQQSEMRILYNIGRLMSADAHEQAICLERALAFAEQLQDHRTAKAIREFLTQLER